MRRSAIALALAAALAPPALADEGDAMLSRVGAEMFQQYCASCHGQSAAGDGPAAGALRTPPADLTRIAARRGGSFPDGEIARFVDGRFDVPAHGTREMPIWGRKLGEAVAEGAEPDEVARGRILALVEYLKTIQAK
ncbi:MAG: cytochrome C [Proteobacteria bacterium]|nr:MAG: cytochrome C [Pseudomonadota bacterium]